MKSWCESTFSSLVAGIGLKQDLIDRMRLYNNNDGPVTYNRIAMASQATMELIEMRKWLWYCRSAGYWCLSSLSESMQLVIVDNRCESWDRMKLLGLAV